MDLALRVRGCRSTKEFKGRLKNDCNTLMNPSLFFQFPFYTFLELSLMLHDVFFSLSVFFYFFLNPPAAIWKMEEPDLPCFLHKAGCQCNDLRLLRWALCKFFFSKYFSIFQQHSLPRCIVTICVKKKSPQDLWFVFKSLRCWKWQCYSKCPNSLSSQVILFSSLPGLQNLSHKIIYLYLF